MEDRSKGSLERTLNRMHIDPAKLPHTMLGPGGLAAGVQRAILAQPTMPAVVFLEGIDLLGDSSDGRSVSNELKLLQQVAEHYHIALVGSTGAPKQKPKEGYVALRDRVIGSTVWARKTETIVVLQRENGKETDDMTLMTVLPRNDKPEEFQLVWERGRFRALTAEEIQAGQEKTTTDAFVEWVFGRETFTRNQAKAAFKSMSGRTLTERLEGMVTAGAVKRHTKGTQVFFSVPAVLGQEA